eukprot:sb/3468810/
MRFLEGVEVWVLGWRPPNRGSAMMYLCYTTRKNLYIINMHHTIPPIPGTDRNKLTTNQNSLFRSRDWLSANQGPVFPDSVASCPIRFQHIDILLPHNGPPLGPLICRCYTTRKNLYIINMHHTIPPIPGTDRNKLTANQNSLFRSRDWLLANQGPVFPDPVASCPIRFQHIDILLPHNGPPLGPLVFQCPTQVRFNDCSVFSFTNENRRGYRILRHFLLVSVNLRRLDSTSGSSDSSSETLSPLWSH